MAEATMYMGISEPKISTLKQTLLDQQQLLQKLYTELDVEREASSTAASEALSMILRLQGEKAAVEMEASQYKRMAEEKMCHAENSLEMFEELIYHKEMEIASLEFQVQAYRYKLLSMGWTDVGMKENRYPENLFPQRCDLSNGEMGFNQNIRKISSLPTLRWKDAYQKNGILKTSSDVPSLETSPIIIEEFFDWENNSEISDMERKYGNNSTMGDLDSYWEQIMRLDNRVKEISKSKCHPPEEKHVVQDIFEVPQYEESYKTQVKERSKSVSKAEFENLGSESEWTKKMLFSSNLEAKPPKPIHKRKKESVCEGSQLGIQQLVQRIERLEKASVTSLGKSEITTQEGLGKEELDLLKEIRQQLNSIQSDMRCWKTKEETRLDETPVITVMEAMLHFWL